MNCVWPISPAQAPRISPGVEIAMLDDPQRIEQMGLEEFATTAIERQRGDRTDHRKVPRTAP